MSVQDEAQRNRERFPIAARVVAEFRSIFGPGVKLRCAVEGGHRAGSEADISDMQSAITRARTDWWPDKAECSCETCKQQNPVAVKKPKRRR